MLYQDLNSYTNSNLRYMSRYFQLPHVPIPDLKWLIAIKNAESVQKAVMPGTVIVEKNGNKTMIFITAGYVYDPRAALRETRMIVSKLVDKDFDEYLPSNVNTEKNSYKAFLLVNGDLAGFSVGKYSPDPFTPVTMYNLLRDSEVKWIEISKKYRGKKLCQGFMEFILKNLYDLNVDNVVVLNVGGLPGCLCYINAEKNLR